MELWEILVPTVRANGRPYRVRFHRVWDRRVRLITGGLTIFQPAVGQWRSPEGVVFQERMIPVRVACTEEQMQDIMALTLQYYEQEAVMAYQVSSKCLFLHRKE